MIKPVHIVILVIVILLLFGAKKLPEIAGSMGKSMKVFKKEVRELREDDENGVPNGSTAAAPQLGNQQYAPQPQQYAQPGQYAQPQPYAPHPQQYAQPGQYAQPPVDAPATQQVPGQPAAQALAQDPYEQRYTQQPGRRPYPENGAPDQPRQG